MKIIAVGWNYANHNSEMGRIDVPTHPTLFMKPDTALLREGKDFFIPDFSKQLEYETELVVRISRMGKNVSEKFAPRYYDAVTVGIDFTARDLQQQLRQAGAPWEIAKAFDNSAAVGEFIPVEGIDLTNLSFRMCLNGEERQTANSSEMLFGVDQLIAYISQFFTLKVGDLIFTGTPVGVGTVAINDRIEGYIGQEKLLDFYVK